MTTLFNNAEIVKSILYTANKTNIILNINRRNNEGKEKNKIR